MIDLSQLRQAHRAFEEAFTSVLDEATQSAADYELANAQERLTTHTRSGTLAAATTTRVIRTTNGRIVRLQNDARSKYGKEYALFVDQGTEAHEIAPRNPRGFLKFYYKGRLVFSKRVNHPGSRPFYPFTYALRSGQNWFLFQMRSRMRALASTF